MSVKTDLMSLSDLKWSYRGEGNANLVLSLPEERIIVRIKKCEYGIEIDKNHELKLIKDVQFHKNIMIALLGKTFVHPPKLARLSEQEIAQIDHCLYNFRPKFRLNKGIRFSLVTCYPDYTRISQNDSNTYCFEIKPKQGWTHPSDRHPSKCAFCGHQYLKFMKKRIHKLSQYCPLDLFSGDEIRMKRSLQNLLVTPQNNLKIFKNGNVIYSEDCSNDYSVILKQFLNCENTDFLDVWSSLMQEALTKPLTEDSPLPSIVEETVDVRTSSGCDWSFLNLPKNSVLHRILMIQKLQKTSFNTIYKMYREKCESEDDYEYVNKLLSSFDDLDPIQRYLLSVTAKDCSIFISFQQSNDKNDNYHYITDKNNVNYRLSIGISDIDPKPLSCLEKHYRRDKDVLSAIKFLENSKIIF